MAPLQRRAVGGNPGRHEVVDAECPEAVRDAVAEWEVEAECREWEAEVAAREAAASQSKVFDPGKPGL